jgi:hypothetical protein
MCLAVIAACGGDDSTDGPEAPDGGDETVIETPVETFIVSGNCPAEPAPTGQPGEVIPGLLVLGFAPTVTVEQAEEYLDLYVTDYRIGQTQFQESQLAIVCVEPGTEDQVTRMFPLGVELRYVQRYRYGT